MAKFSEEGKIGFSKRLFSFIGAGWIYRAWTRKENWWLRDTQNHTCNKYFNMPAYNTGYGNHFTRWNGMKGIFICIIMMKEKFGMGLSPAATISMVEGNSKRRWEDRCFKVQAQLSISYSLHIWFSLFWCSYFNYLYTGIFYTRLFKMTSVMRFSRQFVMWWFELKTSESWSNQ